MSSSAVTFKCYYGSEIRRINLQAGDQPIAYSQLVEQLQTAFAIPPTQQLKLRWLDDEGDKVGLTTAEELADAVRSLIARQGGKPGQAVRIYVTPSDPAEVHEGVTCDGCGCGVSGSRFKCVLCPNFDLCSACVSTNAHSQHPMLLIRRSHHSPQLAGGCRRRWGCGRGQRFRGFFERAAAAAASASAATATGAATAATDAACSEAAAAERPPPPPPTADAAAEEPMATADATCCYSDKTPDPRVARALEHMLAMGFSDDGGWLTRLMIAKEGDISSVLDAIRPAK